MLHYGVVMTFHFMRPFTYGVPSLDYSIGLSSFIPDNTKLSTSAYQDP